MSEAAESGNGGSDAKWVSSVSDVAERREDDHVHEGHDRDAGDHGPAWALDDEELVDSLRGAEPDEDDESVEDVEHGHLEAHRPPSPFSAPVGALALSLLGCLGPIAVAFVADGVASFMLATGLFQLIAIFGVGLGTVSLIRLLANRRERTRRELGGAGVALLGIIFGVLGVLYWAAALAALLWAVL